MTRNNVPSGKFSVLRERLPQIQIKQNIVVALNYHLLPIIELSFSIGLLLGHVFPSKFHLASFDSNALEYSGRAPERAPQLSLLVCCLGRRLRFVIQYQLRSILIG